MTMVMETTWAEGGGVMKEATEAAVAVGVEAEVCLTPVYI